MILGQPVCINVFGNNLTKTNTVQKTEEAKGSGLQGTACHAGEENLKR